MNYTKGDILYEGKTKVIYRTNDEDLLIQVFKDDATAFNKEKHEIIDKKGYLNNIISAYLMDKLNKLNVNTHFIKKINDNEQLIRKLDVLPVEFIVRNIVAGSLSRKMGIEEGAILKQPMVCYCLKSDKLGDPQITYDEIIEFDLCSHENLEIITNLCLDINLYLKTLFIVHDVTLVDFKLEFGIDNNNEIYLADEISPDSCRLWTSDNERLDKDLFRYNTGNIVDSYTKIANFFNLI